VLLENNADNSPIAYYVYGLGLTERISAGGSVVTYHFNLQGSTVALTEPTGGKTTDSYAYDSYGSLANSDGDSSQPFRYLARYGIVDDSTGLLYARARYWSPEMGRFLTKDTVSGKDSDSQSLDRYIYGLGNPLRLNDSSGLSPREFAVSLKSADTFEELYMKLIAVGCPISIAEDIQRCQLNTPASANVDNNIRLMEMLRTKIDNLPMPPPKPIIGPLLEKETREIARYSLFYKIVRNKAPWDYKQQGEQYEAFGNFNYGATGSALGIPPGVLRGAAGVAAYMASTSEPQNGLPFLSPLNGDNAIDQFWIQAGINYYYDTR
jgi:RHS repeat-associated protein